jgi:hypothetical protein
MSYCGTRHNERAIANEVFTGVKITQIAVEPRLALGKVAERLGIFVEEPSRENVSVFRRLARRGQ